ncbi:homoserine O-acetyltransferase/O-succinyltransferase family protein [Macrococcus brunensis]|uniref:homoserine O-acetyltransferase/O-succinyltransferase family protein n=1 Tax=Macrococcus brunensis TaxID=198483 RepID=UPI001EF09D18|nr:homoserine O-succinyltransferase [Macrococcus brunensis]ULG74523.1 homoserine O-succinyltransferase [Macrococcus brunensis]
MTITHTNCHPETLSDLQLDESSGNNGDIRLLVINLMPNKQRAEQQLLQIFHSLPVDIRVTFAYIDNPESVNPAYYACQSYYIPADNVNPEQFDGLIITGAPLEHLDYEEVRYISTLRRLTDRLQAIPYRLFICWGALFALHHYYGIEKKLLPQKLSGIYPYYITQEHPLTEGLVPFYQVPQSRHATVELDTQSEVIVLSFNDELGPDIISTSDSHDTFVLGHLEYDTDTLKEEYSRDSQKNNAYIPAHYFPDNLPLNQPVNQWSHHARQFYMNWLTLIVKHKNEQTG